MPVKNPGHYLIECLDSIIGQSHMKWELIAVDDHSTDDTWSVLSEYAFKDDRITILKNKGVGIIPALRRAYAASHGHYVTRMDADDVMSHNKLSAMLSALLRSGRGHLAVGLVRYFSDQELGGGYVEYANWLNQLTSTATNFSDIYKECSIPSPCWLLHKTDFISSGGFDNDVYPEDYDLAFRFRKAGLVIAPVNEVVHHWRDYKTRTSRISEVYADNRFFKLKVDHFLDQDYTPDNVLFLWGAGRKGKEVARLLNARNIAFRWGCNNPNKIGKIIYDVPLEDQSLWMYAAGEKVIVVVSGKDDRIEIEEMIADQPNVNFYRFC